MIDAVNARFAACDEENFRGGSADVEANFQLPSSILKAQQQQPQMAESSLSIKRAGGLPVDKTRSNKSITVSRDETKRAAAGNNISIHFFQLSINNRYKSGAKTNKISSFDNTNAQIDDNSANNVRTAQTIMSKWQGSFDASCEEMMDGAGGDEEKALTRLNPAFRELKRFGIKRTIDFQQCRRLRCCQLRDQWTRTLLQVETLRRHR